MKTLSEFRRFIREAFAPEETDALDSGAFGLFLILAAIVPFLYETSGTTVREAMGGGAVIPRGDILLEILAFILVAVTFLSRARVGPRRPTPLPLLMLLAIVALGLVQLLPLPAGLLSLGAPTNLKIYHETGEVLGLFGRRLPAPPRISIAPSETASTVLLALAYAAVFISAIRLLRTRRRRRLFVGILFASALVHVLVAVILEGPGNRLHGAFVNPNHFAAYLEVVLALAFATIWTTVLTSSDRVALRSEGGDRLEKRILPILGGMFVWGVVALGIGLTESRGGILSAGITTVALLALATLQRNIRVPAGAVVAIVLVLAAGIFFVARAAGAEPVRRFLALDPRDLGGNTRVALWQTSIQAWKQFPIAGSGLGTFRDAFRRAQPRHLQGVVEQAHSDFLQLLVTGGVVGAIIGVVLFASLFVILFRAWRRQKHREEAALVLAGFGALLSLTLHGAVDFNLSIPAIPATLAFAVGCSFAAARYSRSRRR